MFKSSLGWILLVTFAASGLAAEPRFFRLFVVDASGSMHPERIVQVEKELTELLTATPATLADPVGMFCFSDAPSPLTMFTANDQALAFVASISEQPSGGTQIGAALMQAADVLHQRRSVAGATLLLLTDGLDGGPEATKQAEQRLAALFRERKQKGLHQAVVLRTWSARDQGSSLITALKPDATVTVSDGSGPLPVHGRTVFPTATVVKVDYGPRGDTALVTLRSEIQSSGLAPGLMGPTCQFVCQNVKSPTPWTVSSSAPPVVKTVEAPVSDAEFQAGALTLNIAVSPQASPAGAAGKTTSVATLGRTSFTVPVKLPPLQATYEFAAKAAVTAPGQWADAARRIAEYEVSLVAAVRNIDRGLPVRHPLALDVQLEGGDQLVSGPKSLTLQSGTPLTCKYRVQVAHSAAELQPGAGARTIRFKLRPKSRPPGATYAQSQLVAATKPLSVPPAETQIEVKLESTTPALWHCLPDIAVVRCRLQIKVDGPLPDGSVLMLAGDGNVAQLRLNKHTLDAGEQWMDCLLAVRVQPSPAITTTTLAITPPAVKDGIKVIATPSIDVKVAGPAAAALLRTFSDRPLQALLYGEASTIDVETAFEVRGPVTRTFAESIRASVTGPPVRSGGPYPLFRPAAFSLAAPSSSGSYFFDDTKRVDLTLEAAVPSPALIESPLAVRLHRPAPFKRHLFLALATLAIVGVPVLLARLAGALRPAPIDPDGVLAALGDSDAAAAA